ncbi:MAG: tellurium resistance protein [Clostridiales bacterium GWB2_37_7]|nr:MAG: tellurium resistance protein [Clostridiales bacterium GWB2_37_7]
MNSLTEEQKQKVQEIIKDINVEDSQFVLQYGIGAQNQIASFADNVLSEVRAKDGGFVGEVLSDLMIKVKEIDVDGVSNKSFMSRIPLIGGLMDSSKKFAARYQKLGTEIEKIVEELDKSRMQLLKDITLLDYMFDKNLEYLGNLNHYIIAGTVKLKELNEEIVPGMQLKVQNTNDPVEAQKLNDLLQLVNRFEKKIHDLKLSRMIALQTAPQIRLIQNNNQVLVEKIQSSILNTIPLWKNQIVIALSLYRQKKALEVQREVTNTTNDLLRKNSEMLKESTIGIAAENERGIVDIDTLKKVNGDLISTIEETLKIQQEGREKRKQAEVELANIEKELKDKLVGVRSNEFVKLK